MKRILIVDDEYLVRLGLKTTIDWAAYGCVIAGEAGNGRDALELFEKTNPDVILTDIKMPIMDGLELTRAVKAKNRKVQIIILSHYDEFAYAREALSAGAFRYILKSELTKTNLVTMIRALFDAAGGGDAGGDGGAGKDPAEKRERYIEEHLFPLFGETGPRLPPPPDPALFSPGNYMVISGKSRTTAMREDAKKMFPKTIQTLISEAWPGSPAVTGYHHDQFHFVVICPGEGARKNGPQAAALIVKNIRQYYDANVFMGLSASAGDDIPRLFAESQIALRMCYFSEKEFIGRYRPGAGEGGGKRPPISYNKLSEFLDLNRKEAMLEYIQDIFRELRELGNYACVREAFIDFLSIGKGIREKYNLLEQASLSEGKFSYDTFDDIEFIGDVEFYIYGIFLALLAGKQDGRTTWSYAVKKCIAFIRDNYHRNISLSEAARYAEVSHSYLSFIFKQETGINFNAYLSRYRVEEAKKLLRSTNMRIYEVAEKTGFSNPYYFSKVFKEYTGLNCKSFRDAGQFTP
jgi:two-component system response regulator YesN